MKPLLDVSTWIGSAAVSIAGIRTWYAAHGYVQLDLPVSDFWMWAVGWALLAPAGCLRFWIWREERRGDARTRSGAGEPVQVQPDGAGGVGAGAGSHGSVR